MSDGERDDSGRDGNAGTDGEPAPDASGGADGGGAEPGMSDIDLSDSEWYLNRELSELAFQRRVLHEAVDDRNPPLERAKFLAIVTKNLDEF